MEFITFFAVLLFVASISGREAAVTVNFNHTSKIVGGDDVKPGELPYQLSLQLHGHHYCGASLIKVHNVQLAITAAHCVFRKEHLHYVLVAGVVDLSKTSGFKQSRRVTNVVIHQNYNPRTLSNDIALLFLSDSFKLDKYVGIIALPDELQETVGNVTVSGWGSLQSGGSRSDKLQKIISPVVVQNVCKAAWKGHVQITDGMICLNDSNRKQSPCNGDSGGPAVATGSNDDDGIYLAGVVSFAHHSCGHPDFPAVYTRVSKYVGWMKQMV